MTENKCWLTFCQGQYSEWAVITGRHALSRERRKNSWQKPSWIEATSEITKTAEHNSGTWWLCTLQVPPLELVHCRHHHFVKRPACVKYNAHRAIRANSRAVTWNLYPVAPMCWNGKLNLFSWIQIWWFVQSPKVHTLFKDFAPRIQPSCFSGVRCLAVCTDRRISAHGAICKLPGQKKQSSRALEDLMHWLPPEGITMTYHLPVTSCRSTLHKPIKYYFK